MYTGWLRIYMFSINSLAQGSATDSSPRRDFFAAHKHFNKRSVMLVSLARLLACIFFLVGLFSTNVSISLVLLKKHIWENIIWKLRTNRLKKISVILLAVEWQTRNGIFIGNTENWLTEIFIGICKYLSKR